MKVEVIKQYSIFLPNKPGVLADLSRRFADKGVNIIGLSSEVRDDSAMVRVALDGAGDHSAIISRAGYASVESRLISIEVDDTPGQLYRITRALGEGGVNITNIFGTAAGGSASRLLLSAENTDRALAVLERLRDSGS
ncbi:MAG: ACT domain-containing protein [Elusimicrobiota bacterium]|jgi:hypothetical protein